MNEHKRILVVDDEEMMREILVNVLESEGYVVESVNGGEAALQAIRGNPPHLAVVDLRMPGINGWELITRLKDVPHAPAVVAMSGMGTEEPAELRAIGPHVMGYLPKPFSSEQLLRTCAYALAAERPSPAPASAGAERRDVPRRALVVPATLLGADGTPAATGQILDLCTGGAQLDLGASLKAGLEIQVAFDIPGAHGSFRIQGEIVWNKDGRLGLKFTDLSEADRERLGRVLGD